jgi:ribonuclease HI
MLDIYTDGSTLNNPGPSGWACCMKENGILWVLSGSVDHSTNNRMELLAIIEAIQFTDKNDIMIHTDSQITINCGKGTWKRKANSDMWNIFDSVSNGKNIKWTWVKAHNGDPLNELVDTIARNEAINNKNKNIVS